MKKTTGIIILVVILLFPVLVIFVFDKAEIKHNTLPIYSRDEMGDTIPYVIDTFTLVDQNGQIFTRDSLNNKIFIANFFFASCPDVCPQMNGNVKIATQQLKEAKDIMFISHTVDPYNDTPAVLLDYAQKWEADPTQWRFLTGRKSTIYHLAADSYKAAVQGATDSSDFIHSEKLVLVDRDFHIRGIYEGRDWKEVDEMIEDAKFLFKEKWPADE